MNSVAGPFALAGSGNNGRARDGWRASSGSVRRLGAAEPMACQCSDQPQPCASRRRLEAIRRSDKSAHTNIGAECRWANTECARLVRDARTARS